MSSSRKSTKGIDMNKLFEALALAKKAEKKYANDWNGLLLKDIRVKLEECLGERASQEANEAADRAILSIGILDEVAK